MKNPYHALLMLIAEATQKELAAQVRYLKIELEIARSKLPNASPPMVEFMAWHHSP